MSLADRSTDTLAVATQGNCRTARPASGQIFTSILFEDGRPLEGLRDVAEPDHFRDLHLDQLFASLSAQKPDHDLEPFYRIPLDDPASIEGRQDIVRDLQDPAIRNAIDAFAVSQAQMREALKEQASRNHPLEAQRWFLDAAISYCDGVKSVAAALASAAPLARGMKLFLGHLIATTQGSRFLALDQRAKVLSDAFTRIRYDIVIRDCDVRVQLHGDGEDFAAAIGSAFAKFAQPGHEGWFSFRVSDEVTRIDRKVLERVARLHPAAFAELASFCVKEADFADPLIIRFDREVQFYLSFLERVKALEETGLRLCLPNVGGDGDMDIAEGFDLALASELARQVPKQAPVVNDARLGVGEQFLMVSGPNQGGKTTFARMVGQIHYLARLGLPVPASRARLPLADAIFTHFEREERLADASGKLHEDLVRVHAILGKATGRSLVIFNEIFTSATLDDSRRLSQAVAAHLRKIGSPCLWVTFIDELALARDAVSMVAEVRPEDPSVRTYRVVGAPPAGLAYAQILAERFGVSYERVKERMAE